MSDGIDQFYLSTCPICGADIKRKWDSNTGRSHYIDYDCGLQMRDVFAEPGWRQAIGTHCTNALSAVMNLKYGLQL